MLLFVGGVAVPPLTELAPAVVAAEAVGREGGATVSV